MFTRKKQSATVIVLVVLVVGAMLLSGLSMIGGSGGGGSSSNDDGAPAPEEGALEPLPADHPVHTLVRRDADDPLAKGDVDAPIVMIEYSDFQCPLCSRYARTTAPQLVEEYVNTGQLRIEYRNFPIFGPESDNAARGSWAAGRQGLFWEFYEVAYAEEVHRDSGRFTEDAVRGLAEEAGVPDLEQFTEDMNSEEAGEAVGRDAEEAYQLGVTSTPSFLINGHPLIGAQPADTFREAIDQLLAAEQRS
ncbi:thioredoxin domain-containing protein [Streptomyces sp. ACA25]|uniref:DsbA family protein n=1 Tax=Streptomyces sp. ACA25 TaxID=3022596 RepID=UPI0023073B60|nr:thioredoxin domain-containing protein [Streptomyces sp. ACA25]MDB1087386.1 thioredoxin domain-containing protein [Streptomyces sp. ACA25]